MAHNTSVKSEVVTKRIFVAHSLTIIAVVFRPEEKVNGSQEVGEGVSVRAGVDKGNQECGAILVVGSRRTAPRMTLYRT